MSLKEYENNHFVKENNSIEKYLLRIIKRYFEIEKNYTRETIENIILESLTRFKQMIISESGFIFSLNKLTGHLSLSIRDFGGETAIKKNTAFNKDFGTESDTICEGNDIRLSDNREPIYHIHDILDINTLEEKLNQVETGYGSHIHYNDSVLDILEYTGKQIEFDLIIIEQLEKSLEEYFKNLSTYKLETESIYNKSINLLTQYKTEINKIYKENQDFINDSKSWLNESNQYTDKNVEIFKNKTLQQLLKCVSDDKLQQVYNVIENAYYLTFQNEFPLHDGELSLISTQDDISAASGEGDDLYNIYLEGLRLGNDDWQWNDENHSFIYQHNEGDSYPMFVSLNEFINYTHRVTLSSVDTDDDCISVVLAYNIATGNHLSLIICNGGIAIDGLEGATASILLNFSGTWSLTDDFVINNASIGPAQGWSNTTNGVTVLIKRNVNNFKIWVLYNEVHNWDSSEIDGVKDIYLTEEPLFEFNLTDYPELEEFVNRECNYGYGCYSQSQSTYNDVFFTTTYGATYGHTDISEKSSIEFNVPSEILNTSLKNKFKLYFRYENENNETITSSLPFIFKDSNGHNTIIQGNYTDDGKINILSNYLNTLPLMISETNIYDDRTIITSYSAIPQNRYQIEQSLSEIDCCLCLVDSEEKNLFIQNLLEENKTYYIQGYNLSLEDEIFTDNNGNELLYTDWDENQPYYYVFNSIIINQNKKWQTAIGSEEKHGYIAEYKIKRLSDYFKNPRIYYEILSSKEDE